MYLIILFSDVLGKWNGKWSWKRQKPSDTWWGQVPTTADVARSWPRVPSLQPLAACTAPSSAPSPAPATTAAPTDDDHGTLQHVNGSQYRFQVPGWVKRWQWRLEKWSVDQYFAIQHLVGLVARRPLRERLTWIQFPHSQWIFLPQVESYQGLQC